MVRGGPRCDSFLIGVIARGSADENRWKFTGALTKLQARRGPCLGISVLDASRSRRVVLQRAVAATTLPPARAAAPLSRQQPTRWTVAPPPDSREECTGRRLTGVVGLHICMTQGTPITKCAIDDLAGRGPGAALATPGPCLGSRTHEAIGCKKCALNVTVPHWERGAEHASSRRHGDRWRRALADRWATPGGSKARHHVARSRAESPPQ